MESPAPLKLPTPTPAPDRGGPVACLGGPVPCLGNLFLGVTFFFGLLMRTTSSGELDYQF